ncbi:thiamine-phosphate pyrophosphorylase [Paractinoplanes brasiliensis]|uniref:Thiamine-phosphate synthase n=1 Tax=Paractinoplanes brasiliensis TaxID=52695 RepID=A0A4R6JTJ0_9ACTN|nr:thiamine-phosphate pyrophosphorylase [Actinoplanes brasiliensis]
MLPRLHIVTDSLDIVRGVLGHGPVAVQIRVKTNDREAYALTCAALELCRPAGALCLVDDRIGVALAAGADGVHVGADDLPVAAARRVLGPGPVIGATCRNPSAARAAVADGASYLGVGPAFATGSKSGLPDPIGPDGIAAVSRAVPGTPVIAIAGITAGRVSELDCYGVAVISAVAADPAGATVEFLRALAAHPGLGVSDLSLGASHPGLGGSDSWAAALGESDSSGVSDSAAGASASASRAGDRQ